MSGEIYEVRTRTFTEAVARLVATFKKHNPGIGTFACTCHDGTTVKIRIASNDEPVLKDERAALDLPSRGRIGSRKKKEKAHG